MNSDFKDLLRLLCERNVEFLVVGGYAVMIYTEPRYTKDLDIVISRSPSNTARVIAVLKEFGAPIADLSETDLQQENVFFQLGVAPNRIDIISSIPGIEFESAYQDRRHHTIDDISVPFISKADLIQAKLAAGRPQDLVDAGALAKSKTDRK